jgi:hypothetical protein
MRNKLFPKIASVILGFIMVSTLIAAGIPTQNAAAAGKGYNPNAAVAWAKKNNRNDRRYYGKSEGRWCTTYVTKALRAGGVNIPVINGNPTLGKWLHKHPDLWEFKPEGQLVKGDFIFVSNYAPIPDNFNVKIIDHVVLITSPNKYASWNREWIKQDLTKLITVSYKYSKGIHLKTNK